VRNAESIEAERISAQTYQQRLNAVLRIALAFTIARRAIALN